MEETAWTGRTEFLDQHWKKTRLEFFRRDLKRTLEHFWKPDFKILDCGCGSGLTYEYLEDHIKPFYVGLDFTEEWLELCRNRYPNGKFVYGDVLNLKYPDNSFEIVTSTALLQHIKEWRRALAEMVRVAKHLVVTTTRIHKNPTEVSPVVEVFTWRFNDKEMLAEHNKYGSCEWNWTTDTNGLRKRVGIFTLRL